MKFAGLTQSIMDSFLPLELTIGRPGVEAALKKSIRLYNKYSAVTGVYNIPYTGEKVLELLEVVDSVQDVLPYRPASDTTNIVTPESVILGLNVVPPTKNFFELLALQQTYRQVMWMMTGGFTFQFVKPYLYVDNVPNTATSLAVVYFHKFDETDLAFEYLGETLEWIKDYAIAEIKTKEGRVLRNASVVGLDTDGDSLVSEGKEEKESLIEQIRSETSPPVFIRS